MFLDVRLIRSNSFISSKIYQKNTNTNIYINWKSFALNHWKWRILKTLVTRAVDLCPTDEYLKEELEHIETALHHRNKYPLWATNKVINVA